MWCIFASTMPRGSSGLAAGEAVLGLVIEEPDHGFGLERRLEERFSSARFAYSTAYNALYRLERDGLVRVVDSEQGVRNARYEATEKGVEHFRAWVRKPTRMPVLREELHAKIALCEPRDLPRMIEMVHLEELACARELNAIRERMLEEEPAPGTAAAGTAAAERQWSELMALAVAHGEAAYWSGRVAQLSQLRAYLDELMEEAQRRMARESRERRMATAGCRELRPEARGATG